MKPKCSKCNKTLIVPSWKICNECDRPIKKEKPVKKTNFDISKFIKNDDLEYLRRTRPARKSKKIRNNNK